MAGEGAPAHAPVLLAEVLALTRPSAGETALDATVGQGGHALALSTAVGPHGIVVGLDRDEAAVEAARAALAAAPSRVVLRRANFADLGRELDAAGVDRVDVALFDLGMSSAQVGDPARGFSFMREGPLDMRYDRAEPVTAEAVVNEWPEDELADVFERFGEEREAGRVAREIVRARSRERVKTTLELASLVERARRGRRGRIHPATKVFQALRIAVNRELECIERALDEAFARLAPGGRLAAISFHSVEDRVVKLEMKGFVRQASAEAVTKKVVRPSRAEVVANPRARSAKLRVVRRMATDGTDGAAS
jgi:16S rRNA (cytosine1402-N4)-methyltransferase